MKTATVLLLDMGGTFMFDCDRFDDPQSLYTTYQHRGGEAVPAHELHTLIAELVQHMGKVARDPERQNAFPSICEALAGCDGAKRLSSHECQVISQVVEAHEIGEIPQQYKDVLAELGKRHRLGVVSNVWAPSEVFRRAFADSGIGDLFEVTVFSSDHRCVKPSPRLFELAIEQFDTCRERMTFVGNDLRCDIAGAAEVGLGTVWINAEGQLRTATDPTPDREVSDLAELLQV